MIMGQKTERKTSKVASKPTFNEPKDEILYKGGIAWLDNRHRDFFCSGLEHWMKPDPEFSHNGIPQLKKGFDVYSFDFFQVFLRFYDVKIRCSQEPEYRECIPLQNQRYEGITFEGQSQVKFQDAFISSKKYVIVKLREFYVTAFQQEKWVQKRAAQLFIDIFKDEKASKGSLPEPTIISYVLRDHVYGVSMNSDIVIDTTYDS